MTEPKGPFDAVLAHLRIELKDAIDAKDREQSLWSKPTYDPWINECRSAILVLEAARKVSTVVEFKVKSIGNIAVENIEAIADMPGIVKKTYHEKK